MANKLGLLQRLSAGVSRLLNAKELVGFDANGNKYYRWPAKNSYGDPVEKRMVQTPDRRYDPELVPPEWSQWLKMTRLEPPSEEEIAGCLFLPAISVHPWNAQLQLPDTPHLSQRMTARRLNIKRKAAALEAAEAQRRFQAETLGEAAQPAEGPNQDRFLQQLTGRGYAQEEGGSRSATEQQGQGQRQRQTQNPNGASQASRPSAGDEPRQASGGGSKDFQADTWAPKR